MARRKCSKDQHSKLNKAYEEIRELVSKNRLEVKMPRLLHPNKGTSKPRTYTVSALMLIYFYSHIGEVKTITELKRYLVSQGCRSLNPQPRHLGMQHGFRFLVHNCVHPNMQTPLRQGEYCLLNLARPHPSARFRHRDRNNMLSRHQFSELCKKFNNRCAVCGSKAGEPHFKNALLVTTIEKGHADPRRPLTSCNCIPMCRMCNGAYKNKVAFNARGIVVRWLV